MLQWFPLLSVSGWINVQGGLCGKKWHTKRVVWVTVIWTFARKQTDIKYKISQVYRYLNDQAV